MRAVVSQFIRNYPDEVVRMTEDIKADIATHLEPFGLDLRLAELELIEVVLGQSERLALVFTTPDPFRSFSRRTIEIKGFADEAGTLDKAFGTLARFRKLKLTLRPGTLVEHALIKKVNSDLGTLSPNGRMLANTSLQSVLLKLANDKNRRIVSRMLETFRIPVPGFVFGKLEAGETIDMLISWSADNPDLINTSYSITCEGCFERYLTYGSEEKARESLEHASKTCETCGEKDVLTVKKHFQPTVQATQGIRQGLWLEKMVERLAEERSILTVSGRMLETNELDVVSVAHDTLVLFECKDGSFGQNDYYIMAMKAKELEADVMVAVTTQEVSENVKRIVQRHSDDSEDSSPIHLIEASSEKGIQDGVNGVFDLLEESYKNLIQGVELVRFRRGKFRPYG
jgi:hypothetical protein